ncbi:unnamed protein product [Candidula unifasciata]|uniref:Kelch domain-containing protein 9 n=1 Tax=Candidula unifasciata TaxID=100452 RepID=A0A8S3ZC31_9EUPU|nr:unnamed protein product [Candidula unifasciata]
MSTRINKISTRAASDVSDKKASVNLQWVPVAPLGPKAAFHVGGVVNDVLYIHGGIQEAGSNQPSNQFYKLDLKTTFWEEIHTPGSPFLSHHAAVVLEDRYLLLIGGWDGRKRGSELHVYDSQEDKWSQMKQSGFPLGAGLSNHTANKLSDGKIIIIGRDGSLRTQRRHGSIYILSGSVASGHFTYTEYSNEIISRSGHTTNVIGSNVFILGGRSDSVFEKTCGFQGTKTRECGVLTKLLTSVESRPQTPLQRFPCGRKNHVAIGNEKCIFVHGGETFDGRREPTGEMLLIVIKTPVCFFQLSGEPLRRAGHVCFALSDRIFLHGGLSGKTNVHADLYDLVVKS